MDSRFAGGVRRRAPWLVALLCLSAQARAQEPEPPPPASEQNPAPAVVAVKPPLSWAGTTLAWDNQFSAKILGIGPDYIGSEEEESFVTAFSLTPSYFILWRPRHQLSVSARVTLFSELTNSDTTALKHSVELADIPLGLDYAATLFSHGHGKSIGGLRTMTDPTLLGEGDFRTWALVSSYLVFPTSPESRAAGVDLATSIGVGLRQQIRLLGGDSPWLSYLLITASESWVHAFTSQSQYNGPYSIDPRPVALPNTLSHAINFTLPIYRALHLDSTFKLRTGIPSSAGGSAIDCVAAATGCVYQEPGRPSTLRWSTVFSVGLSYEIIPELGVALGYFNDASQIGEDGLKRSIFYSQSSKFYANVTFSFDRLYQRLFPPKPEGAGPTR
jgi:hypothetical protein